MLTPSLLAKDAPIPGLAAKITALGYLDGRERTFQGESRHLTLVVSRFLSFKDTQGAKGFVQFVQANSASFFGGGATEQALTAQGRTGMVFTLAPCACHMASPALVGVVPSGSGVVWLEINGPDATASLLTSLLDPAKAVQPDR